MNGVTSKGVVIKSKMPSKLVVQSVPRAKNLNGSTSEGYVHSSKSSKTAGFGASRRVGSVKGS